MGVHFDEMASMTPQQWDHLSRAILAGNPIEVDVSGWTDEQKRIANLAYLHSAAAAFHSAERHRKRGHRRNRRSKAFWVR